MAHFVCACSTGQPFWGDAPAKQSGEENEIFLLRVLRTPFPHPVRGSAMAMLGLHFHLLGHEITATAVVRLGTFCPIAFLSMQHTHTWLIGKHIGKG